MIPFQDIIDISKQKLIDNQRVPETLEDLIRTGVNIDYTTPYDLRVKLFIFRHL